MSGLRRFRASGFRVGHALAVGCSPIRFFMMIIGLEIAEKAVALSRWGVEERLCGWRGAWVFMMVCRR